MIKQTLLIVANLKGALNNSLFINWGIFWQRSFRQKIINTHWGVLWLEQLTVEQFILNSIAGLLPAPIPNLPKRSLNSGSTLNYVFFLNFAIWKRPRGGSKLCCWFLQKTFFFQGSNGSDESNLHLKMTLPFNLDLILWLFFFNVAVRKGPENKSKFC